MFSASIVWMRFISFVLLTSPRARGRLDPRNLMALPKARPPRPCICLGLRFTPGRDPRMIPRSQHFGDRAPFPLLRSGIMRVFEQSRFEALVHTAGRRSHYAGKQPNASVEQHQRAHLAARQDIVADRDLFDRPPFEASLVAPLEPAAQDARARAACEPTNAALRQRHATWRHRQA